MPHAFMYEKLDLDVIDRLMDLQSNHAKQGKQVGSVLLVLDDVSWESAHFKRPAPTMPSDARTALYIGTGGI